MPVRRKKSDVSAEADMTPMIDMTFQLIAFFMILINFSDDNLKQEITLPSSDLAKPPEGAVESPITLQVNKDGKVLYGGDAVPLENMKPFLIREVQILTRAGKSPKQAHVIIRADRDLDAGQVQELIRMCQDEKFEQFSLRAKQETDSLTVEKKP